MGKIHDRQLWTMIGSAHPNEYNIDALLDVLTVVKVLVRHEIE